MEAVKAFLSAFMSAVSTCTLYSGEHAAVSELARRALLHLDEILQDADSLDLMIVDDDLIANKAPLRDIGVQGDNFVRRLKRKGLSRVDILKGISHEELVLFIRDISATSHDQKTYTHIRTGVIDVRLRGFNLDPGLDFDADGLAAFTSGQVEKVKDVYHGLTPFKKLNIAGLEEIVVNFIITFRREASILRLISPVKSFSEYTYTHATNVAVLSMFQAETMGVRDDLLRDIGISALLHDVGKLFIDKELIEKKEALNERDWQEVRMHPVYGAKYLAETDGLPRLAAIATFEHHRRFDGTGYPKLTVNKKKQHLCSQTIAIADYFDALRSRRPYRKSLDIKEVLVLMKQEAGRALNPFLLDIFIASIHKALSE